MPGQLKPPVSSTDHAQGNLDSSVTLVEYGDYQCPYCGQAYPIVKRIQKRLDSRLCFVFRNFPLAEAHPFAMEAAEMAEGAALQDKFWQMHDLLYEHQDELETERLVEYPSFFTSTWSNWERISQGPKWANACDRTSAVACGAASMARHLSTSTVLSLWETGPMRTNLSPR